MKNTTRIALSIETIRIMIIDLVSSSQGLNTTDRAHRWRLIAVWLMADLVTLALFYQNGPFGMNRFPFEFESILVPAFYGMAYAQVSLVTVWCFFTRASVSVRCAGAVAAMALLSTWLNEVMNLAEAVAGFIEFLATLATFVVLVAVARRIVATWGEWKEVPVRNVDREEHNVLRYSGATHALSVLLRNVGLEEHKTPISSRQSIWKGVVMVLGSVLVCTGVFATLDPREHNWHYIQSALSIILISSFRLTMAGCLGNVAVTLSSLFVVFSNSSAKIRSVAWVCGVLAGVVLLRVSASEIPPPFTHSLAAAALHGAFLLGSLRLGKFGGTPY